MGRWRYFLQRVLLSIPVLFLVITFLFVVLRLDRSTQSRRVSVHKRLVPMSPPSKSDWV